MVNLFSKKKEERSKEFKFEASIKLKDLPIEEYSHLLFAFQTSILRFERMLKESLLEGFITSTTLERISREFKIDEIRDIEVTQTESLIKLFGNREPIELAKIATTKTSAIKQTTSAIPSSTVNPVTPATSVSTPNTTIPSQSTILTKTSTVSLKSTETSPTINFSFPETSLPSHQPSPSMKEPIKPLSQSIVNPANKPEALPTSLQIPKISFPTLSKIPPGSPSDTITRSKSHREEDRATGIAILRKQMLTELKKIRSVVSENER